MHEGLREASTASPARALNHTRRLGALVALSAAALGVFAVSPALAADQQVQAEDNSFVLPGVAVKPGESVTWRYPGNSETHNVHFEDGKFTNPAMPIRGPWTSTRTFPSEGTFLWYCENHGGPGGQGMSGVVYVNDTGTVPGTPPAASFTVSPGVASLGQNVSFNATGTSDPDGTIIRHEWDLDGNGSFETDTGGRPNTALSYASPGPRTVKLRVTDSQRHSSVTTRSLMVTADPIASFTVSPSPAQTGRVVSFNASASSDPDGTIARYEWDLDGDGSFETDSATTPMTSRSYPSPGTVTVKLRVTDDLGVTSVTTRSLRIDAPSPPQSPSQSPPAPNVRLLPNVLRPRVSARQVGRAIRVRVSGRMLGNRGRACSGRIKVGTRAGVRRVATRTGRMGANCRYSTSFRVPLKRLPQRLRPRRKLLIVRASVRYQGNSLLATDLSPTGRARVKR